MLTRQEIVEKYNDYEKQSSKESFRFFVAFGIILFSYLAALFYLMSQVPPDSFWYVVLMIFFFGSLGILFFFSMKMDKKKLRHLRLSCPHCSKQLRRDITVATGRCGSCGEKIFEMDK